MNNLKNTVILYHAECSDGFGAAWAAWKKFGQDADYIPVYHDHPLPEGLVNKDIYTLDFTFPMDLTKQLISQNKKVTSIDHHITAKDIISLTQDYLFDNDHSGSVLAWKYFHQKPVPKILEYVEDTDLWRFKLPNSREIFSVVALYDRNFEDWNMLAEKMDDSVMFNFFVSEGDLLIKHESKLIDEIIRQNCQTVEFEGIETFCVNATLFGSQIASVLATTKPPIGIVWSQHKDYIKVSLRSNGFDVSKLAAKYGGGGHIRAAGFSLPLDSKLPWKII